MKIMQKQLILAFEMHEKSQISPPIDIVEHHGVMAKTWIMLWLLSLPENDTPHAQNDQLSRRWIDMDPSSAQFFTHFSEKPRF